MKANKKIVLSEFEWFFSHFIALGQAQTTFIVKQTNWKYWNQTNKSHKHHCTIFIQGQLLDDRREIQRFEWIKAKWFVNCIWGFYSSGHKKVSWSAGKQNGFMNHTYTNSSQGNFSIWLLEFGLSNQVTHSLWYIHDPNFGSISWFDWLYPFVILKNMLAPCFGWVGFGSGSAKANY